MISLVALKISIELEEITYIEGIFQHRIWLLYE